MSISDIIIPSVSLLLLGGFFGVILTIATKKLSAERDEKIDMVLSALPGTNCGACGEAGCAAYAARIVKNGAKINLCTVGGDLTADKIAAIMNVSKLDVIKMRAVVNCQGGSDDTKLKFEYQGPRSCRAAQMLSAGNKICEYGCLGLGDCAQICSFGAIKMTDKGLPSIDRKKCTGCTLCEKECPRKIISMIEAWRDVYVKCSNHENAQTMKKGCSAGCISCAICVNKACKEVFILTPQAGTAINIDNFLAVIDYSKCTDCGKCAQICPQKVIQPKRV